jgi:hypothetical protein
MLMALYQTGPVLSLYIENRATIDRIAVPMNQIPLATNPTTEQNIANKIGRIIPNAIVLAFP